MKIGIVIQPISMIGGIYTHAAQLKQGLIACGVDCDVIAISKSGKAGKKEPLYDVFLGYSDNQFQEMQNTLQTYDALIHEVIPHRNKGFNTTDWQRCFIENTKHIVIYHDTLAKTYEWITDVSDVIWAHVGVQEKTVYSFKHFDYNDYEIIRHPIDTNINCTVNKEPFALSPHQWKSWKRMDKVVEATIFQKHKTYTSNTGIVCRYMQSKMEEYTALHDIWTRAEQNGNHVWLGFCDISVLNQFYEKSSVLIDISRGELGSKTGLPNINYSTLEGMLYEALPVVSKHEYDFPNFPKENPFVVDETNIVRSIAKMVDAAIENYDDYKELIIKNKKFVIDNFDRKRVAQKYLEIINGPKRKQLKLRNQRKGFFK